MTFYHHLIGQNPHFVLGRNLTFLHIESIIWVFVFVGFFSSFFSPPNLFQMLRSTSVSQSQKPVTFLFIIPHLCKRYLWERRGLKSLSFSQHSLFPPDRLHSPGRLLRSPISIFNIKITCSHHQYSCVTNQPFAFIQPNQQTLPLSFRLARRTGGDGSMSNTVRDNHKQSLSLLFSCSFTVPYSSC